MIRTVLAIETSCDDTSVAVVERDGHVRAVVSANQDLVHQPFGGIVPEIASRNHTLHLLPLLERALEKAALPSFDKIDAIAVTSRPGLIGSLLVGVMTAKTLALARGIPFLGVNHLEAHLLAPFLKDDGYAPPKDFTYPYVALAVSGGHTQLYEVRGLGEYHVLGRTLDDAAGEAFDKFAKLVGLGFPGGPAVDRQAATGDMHAFEFPRPLIHEDGFDFSFSGLKAAAARLIAARAEAGEPVPTGQVLADLCASYQAAVTDVLIHKLDAAVKAKGVQRAVITGGVSANSMLRAHAEAWAKKTGVQMVIPPLRYCTDNAAMVGLAGLLRLQRGETSPQSLKPLAHSLPEDFRSGDSR